MWDGGMTSQSRKQEGWGVAETGTHGLQNRRTEPYREEYDSENERDEDRDKARLREGGEAKRERHTDRGSKQRKEWVKLEQILKRERINWVTSEWKSKTAGAMKRRKV